MQHFSQFCSILSRVTILIAVLAFTCGTSLHAQNDEPQTEPVDTPVQSLTQEQADQLNQLLDELPEQRKNIAELERRVAAAEGLTKDILSLRLDLAWLGLLEDTLAFTSAAAKLSNNGVELGEFQDDVTAALGDQFEIAKTTIELTAKNVKLPTPDMSPTDRAIAFSQVFTALDTINRVYDVFSQGIEIARGFGLNVEKSEQYLRDGLADRALNTSVFLEMAARDIAALKSARKIAPDDTSIAASLSEAENRLKAAAGELERIANRMGSLGMDTSDYRAQILQATGEISAGLFNINVIAGLLSKWWANTTGLIITEGPGFIFKLLLFVVIVFIARKFALLVKALVKRGLSSSRVRVSILLEKMILSTVSNLILLIGILIGLAQLGISVGPLLAGLGIAGFIIGFALQDTLSNFASGMMILFYRPFDVGDFIESNGVLGKVSHMSLVNTTILTIDNQTIVLPNNMVWQNMIKNITGQALRRVDLVFGVSYSDDIPKVEKILADVVASQEQVLDEPEPQIRLHELGDSSVNFVVRPWVKTEDYWDVYWDLMRKVKMRFDEEGISIPFPQRDVHHYYAEPPPQPLTGG